MMVAKKNPKSKKKSWGGHRPNAGRKSSPDSKRNINFRLHPKYIDMLKAECAGTPTSVSDILQIAVKMYFVDIGKLPKSELDADLD
jgi:hypothetical protein